MVNEGIRILVAVDLGSSAVQAVEAALTLATKTGGRLDIVHVIPSDVDARTELLGTLPEELCERAPAEERLFALRERAIASGLDVAVHLRMGAPVDGLVDAIRELKPDLVVVGRRSQWKITRAVFGSVSEELVRRSPAPVVVLPSDERAEMDLPPPAPVPEGIAWSCAHCGHLRGLLASAARCPTCGTAPAIWTWATVYPGPIDSDLPAAADSATDFASLPDVSPPPSAVSLPAATRLH